MNIILVKYNEYLTADSIHSFIYYSKLFIGKMVVNYERTVRIAIQY